MSERGSGKSRKTPVSKTLVSKTSASKTPGTKRSASKAPSTKTLAVKEPASKTPVKAARPAAKAASKSRGSGAAKASTARPKKAAENTSPLDAPSLMARVIRLESERDRLQLELANAVSRIRLLEEGREQVVNRIDWVIDSLRGLVDD